MTLKIKRKLCLLAGAAMLFTGCAVPTEENPPTVTRESLLEELEIPLAEFGQSAENAGNALNPSSAAQSTKKYEIPAFRTAEFHADKAQGPDNAKIDISEVSKGYVAVKATSASRLKFQVITESATYNYDLKNDGTPGIFPLQSGNTTYRFRVMQNTSGTKYAELFSTTAAVTLEGEFAPYLRTSNYVPYTTESACVKKARELAAGAEDSIGVIAKIYDYVCATVTYDKVKAATVKTGYLSDPDSTMNTGTGICFDYAVLAAAMLRSLGIPTKMVFGYVAPNGVYHAWNMFYTKETGWVTVGFEANREIWTRMDLTFSANGANEQFIGNGSNYADVYYY